MPIPSTDSHHLFRTFDFGEQRAVTLVGSHYCHQAIDFVLNFLLAVATRVLRKVFFEAVDLACHVPMNVRSG